MQKVSRNIKTAAIVIAAVFLFALLGYVYYHFDPSNSVYCPKCPVQALLGIPCPGCGSQRAFHSLLHLRPAEAFRFNYALPFGVAAAMLMIFAQVFRHKFPRLHKALNSRRACYITLAAILVWWAARLIFHV